MMPFARSFSGMRLNGLFFSNNRVLKHTIDQFAMTDRLDKLFKTCRLGAGGRELGRFFSL